MLPCREFDSPKEKAMLYGEVKDYLPLLSKLFEDTLLLQKMDELVKTSAMQGNNTLTLQMLVPTKRIENKVMATLFFEPSTRTRLSFESAMLRLGGKVITANDESSSLMKGESISDTIRTVSEYADVIVVRCDQPISRWGTVNCPVINAGDGIFNHPTQALADFYAVYQAKRRVLSDVLKVGIAGDIENSRTIRSFSEIMEDDGHEVFLYDSTEEEGLAEFEAMLTDLDVLYLNRVQRERHNDNAAILPSFRLSDYLLSTMKEDAVILNPGPRQEEMPEYLTDSRIMFWDQIRNGLYIRMAILRHIFGCNA